MIEIAHRRGVDLVNDYSKELKKHPSEAFLFRSEDYYQKRIRVYSDIDKRLKNRYRHLTLKLSFIAEQL